MPPIIGIDLGTTNTAVAVLENGRPRVIEDDRGYKVLPSVVSAKGEGRYVVGQAAHNLILTRPDRTVYATKRLMGRRFDSHEVQRVLPRIGYAVREAPDGGVHLQVGDTWMTPQEVAAVVLQVARGIAEKALGQPIEEAVITVPAHFNHAQRKATMEAAQIAGLRCERLLNEPTAAALAYGHRKNVDRTLVIFDLGGGTFDVSVLRLTSGIYEILSTNGDTFLGGEDFDYRVVDHLADEFKVRTGIDLRADRAALQRVKDAAERAKCELSFSDRATVVVAHAAPGHNLETTLTRVQLEQLTNDLVERCVEVARDAVVEAGLTISDIDEVILVGGQTRMPRVREAVAGLFGREASRSVHPEEAVAIGAAVHAATLGDVEGTPAVLLDVTPFDLGIDSAGGIFSCIVPRNARIPCSESRVFATVQDEQTSVRVTVRQGESRVAEENEFLGELQLEGLTPAPRMQTKVAVTFRIDANGMLHVSALEPATGEKRNISIRNYADRTRTVSTGVPTGAPGAAAATPDSKVAKKKGFFDSLFGGGGKAKKPTAAATVPAAAPLAAAATDSAAPPDLASAAVLEPPPTIAPLPTPTSLPEPEEDLDEAFVSEELAEVEPDGAVPFEMPDELGEEDLYDPATAGPASFGLAGAHQVGEAAGGADPFADLGAPAPPRRSAGGDPFASAERSPPAAHAGNPFAADPFATEDAADAGFDLGGLDASDLFGAMGEEEAEDPPTDPGLRFPSVTATAAPATPVPVAEEALSGLLFESLVEPEPSDPPTDDEFGFSFDDAPASSGPEGEEIDFAFDEPAPAAPAAPASPAAPAGADAFGFSLQGPPSAPPEPPRRPAARASGDGDSTEIFRRADLGAADDDFGFEFPMPEDEPPPEPKKRKPARVKLAYRERAQLVSEYVENLQKGGALIRTEKPLATGRECVFEVSGPGLFEPLVIPARVTRTVPGGMEVEYDLDDGARTALLAALGA